MNENATELPQDENQLIAERRGETARAARAGYRLSE